MWARVNMNNCVSSIVPISNEQTNVIVVADVIGSECATVPTINRRASIELCKNLIYFHAIVEVHRPNHSQLKNSLGIEKKKKRRRKEMLIDWMV